MYRSQSLLLCCSCIFFLFTGCDSDDTSDDGPVDASVGMDSRISDGPAADGTPADSAVVPGVASTERGKVKGKVGVGYTEFLGIPYAQPPVGALRWRAPLPAKSWTKTLETTKFSPSCPQIPITGLGVPDSYAEDCLTLNVWTPSLAPQKPMPVMVWIHGGGFTVGGSSQTTYNGANIARTGSIVLVSINYRLGPLGFWAHPSLGEGSGNFGVLDQQLALSWVQKNIASFGGDPKQVTIFGESAGSMSVGVHQAAPGSKDLFHRAIMESGGLGDTLISKARAETQGKEFVTKLACDTAKLASEVMTCMRGKKVDDVLKALPLKKGFFFGAGASWGPTIDGKVLPDQPMNQIKAGKGNMVPLIIGSNGDEGTLFLMLAGMMALTTAQYEAAVKVLFLTKSAEVLKEYPASGYSSAALAFADLLGDLAFVCPTRRSARALTAAGKPAYVYHFTVKPSFSLLPWLGAYHSAEIPFVFGNAKFTTDEKMVSDKMMSYWTTFAQSGDPNDPKSSFLWPKYDKTTDPHMELGLKLTTGKKLKTARCDFWDKLGTGI